MKVLYDRVNERLQEIGMSWCQLEELVEQKTDLFIRIDYIKGRLKKRKRISRKMFHAVAEIIGEEIVYGKRKFERYASGTGNRKATGISLCEAGEPGTES